MIKIFYSKTKKEAGVKAANSIAKVINQKENSVLGLATGSSPTAMYDELISMCKNKDISFKNVKTINLDEYIGLPKSHNQSYDYFMREHLFDAIDIDPKNTNLPNGLEEDYEKECKRYNELFESLGGTDVQVLGIGLNGHIGFNEPSESFTVGTAAVKLTESTIKANSRFFEKEEDVPTMAISMGIDQIMKSGKIILLADGDAKAEILERALFGEVTPRVPASVLRLAKDVEVYADEKALAVIMNKHPESVICD